MTLKQVQSEQERGENKSLRPVHGSTHPTPKESETTGGDRPPVRVEKAGSAGSGSSKGDGIGCDRGIFGLR